MLCRSQVIRSVYRTSFLAPRPPSLSRTGTHPTWRQRRICASAAMTVAEGPAEVWEWIEDMNQSYESAQPLILVQQLTRVASLTCLEPPREANMTTVPPASQPSTWRSRTTFGESR